jgi:hypothetical protein
MTEVRIHSAIGGDTQLDKLDVPARPKDKLALALVVRDWCKGHKPWRPGEVWVRAWDQSGGWQRYSASDLGL